MVENQSQITFLDPSLVKNIDFFTSIEDLITCLFCQGIVISPKQCSNCESSFCEKCIFSWEKKKNQNTSSCPKRCLNSSFIDSSRMLNNMLSKIELSCPNDCEKTLNYENIFRHNEICDNKEYVLCHCCKNQVKVDSTMKIKKEIERIKTENKELTKKLTETELSLTNKDNQILELKQKIDLQSSVIDFHKNTCDSINKINNNSTKSHDSNKKMTINDSFTNEESVFNEFYINKFYPNENLQLKPKEEFISNDVISKPEQVTKCKHYERNYKIVLKCCLKKMFFCKKDHKTYDECHKKSKIYIKICNSCQSRNLQDSVQCEKCLNVFYSIKIRKNRKNKPKNSMKKGGNSKISRRGLDIYDEDERSLSSKSSSDEENEGGSRSNIYYGKNGYGGYNDDYDDFSIFDRQNKKKK